MLESEAFEDTDARKNERKGLLSCLQDETVVKELRALVTFLVKLQRRSVQSDNEFARLQPPGARGWYAPVRQRYQVFYKRSSCSRALRLLSPCRAATEVTQRAWTTHLATHSTDVAQKGPFEASRWA